MYKLVKIARGYPLALAGEFTACTFSNKQDALSALGPWKFADGYAGTFSPHHPAATDYYLVAVSLADSSLAVVSDTHY